MPGPRALCALLLAACACAIITPLGAQARVVTAAAAIAAGDGPATAAGTAGRALHAVAPGPATPVNYTNVPLNLLKLPPGFSVSVFVNASTQTRFFAVGNRGRAKPLIVYVSTTRERAIHAVVDRGNGSPRTACALLTGLETPNGIAYDAATGSLYIAEVRRIMRYDNVDAAALQGCKASLLTSTVIAGPDKLPEQAAHPNRGLGIGPDGKLYVTIAAPFNVDTCVDPYCTIHRLNKDGSGFEVFARGIRNAAHFDWHPTTKALVFSGMERDMMGDDRPDDILGVVYPEQAGIDLKWPYCHWLGGGPERLRKKGPGAPLADPDMTPPEFGTRPNDTVIAQRCAEIAAPPLQALGPHIAPLGTLYWPEGATLPPAGVQRWPAQWTRGFFNVQHGSWNRESPLGYRVAFVKLAPDGRSVERYSIFAEGWLQNGTAWGRPSGLARLPDGSLLVGDDRAQAIYRISYTPPKLPPGVYAVRLADRPSCPGFLATSTCGRVPALSLARTGFVNLTAFQKWQISPVNASHTTIEGVPVLIRSVGRAAGAATCAASSYVTSNAACTAAPLGSTTRGSWVLQRDAGGGFYIRSRPCAGKALAVARACSATMPTLLPANPATSAMLWTLIKA